MNTDTTVFHIFRRTTGTGFVPYGWPVSGHAATEHGAQTALRDFLNRRGYVGTEQCGMWLVQSALGAWLIKVTPPAPSDNVFTVVC